MGYKALPIPKHFDESKVGEVWRVPYQEIFNEAIAFRTENNIEPAVKDDYKVCLTIIDAQNTFCIPNFGLYVGGKSGKAAIEDNIRLCKFIYQNLNIITEIIPTMDTHTAMQIFFPFFWIDADGNHPTPGATVITFQDVENGKWKVNPAIANNVADGNYDYLQKYALHYVKQLSQSGKYDLMIWPWHAMLGGIGHALVSAIEQAAFFHNICRNSQTGFELKGGNPLTENYSVLKPEVLTDADSNSIAEKNKPLIQKLLDFDMIIIGGQAKSHCVAWTIDDLLNEILMRDSKIAEKVYLLEDCTSPVVIPDVIDFSKQADEAFERFRDAGMHVVKSTEPISKWKGEHPFK